jgi:glutamyl/glutaminyl-tRNA synthetase
VILDDIALLGLKPDMYSYTSDHFDTLMTLCERMIREGTAYADDTDPEVMKKEREERTESKNRNNCTYLTHNFVLCVWFRFESNILRQFADKTCFLPAI